MSGWLTTPLSDAAARRTALTDTAHGLLVEAGAGSGKTAILAGRVALLLAEGVAPSSIAAITFTELAAAELAARVREYVAQLALGEVPTPLQPAFGDGAPTSAQRERLASALTTLDELTSTTIHGFARELTLPYPVEAGVDPGATVIDAGAADLLFDDVFDAWLRSRLGSEAAPDAGPDADDPLALLLTHPAAPGLKGIKELAQLMRAHPGMHLPPSALEPAASAVLAAADTFCALVEAESSAPEKLTELSAEVSDYAESLRALPSATHLAIAAVEHEPGPLFTTTGGVRKLKAKGVWVSAVRSTGASAADATASYEVVANAYLLLDEAITALAAMASDHLLGVLMEALDEVVTDYAEAKRQRAGLDFDDLIANAARLLRDNEQVRVELAQRYLYVLVDEFQDTDPVQAEIVWRLTGVAPTVGQASEWRAWPARPGARFVVGDPNQSIYRFRGADSGTYNSLRAGLTHDDGSLTLRLSNNFRSVPDILANANQTFAGPLTAPGQAGYSDLDARRLPLAGPALVRLQVVTRADTPGALEAPVAADGAPVAATRKPDPAIAIDDKRRAEAVAVAALCCELVAGTSGLLDGPVSPGDIALLAPGYTGLEHYERELEALGLGVASQAGKGFYRRQEVQDLVALTAALADPHNTLALGAFLRGPMIGVTDEELLDVAHALEQRTGDARLTLAVDPTIVPVARVAEVLGRLAPISAARYDMAPFALLALATEVLELRPVLVDRHPGRSDRALANLGRFLQGAKAYSLRGLRAYADDVWAAWQAGEAELEGRIDAAEDAISITTMHSAKGLEWRVVIPVSSMAGNDGPRSPWFSRHGNRPVMSLLGQAGQDAGELLELEKADQHAERMRLWYVTATRARDLLVVPSFDFDSGADAWCNLTPWQDETNWHSFTITATGTHRAQAGEDRAQSPEEFAEQTASVARAARTVERRAPSRQDDGAASGLDPAVEPAYTPPLGALVLAGLNANEDEALPQPGLSVGTARGILLHKLLEEIINASAAVDLDALTNRAAELLAALDVGDLIIDPNEVAAMAERAWHAPEVSALASRLVAEMAVSGVETDPVTGNEVVWGGVADAIAVDDSGKPEVVIDWKSDRAPRPETLTHYEDQVRAYLRLTGASTGLIVLAALGEVRVVHPK
ncbi:MAG TPA: UvrD-helicase domain-containing protein [Trueperaceae bacterium]|nr:UvrD-helicase domain-containing protein [Trueperaceae bacterium]